MALTHNSTLADNEPSWGSVDKTELPRVAFADRGDPEKKSTWSYPHHWVKNGGDPDGDGILEAGDMYLHRGGLNAAWAAANGAHTGQKASPEVISHLEKHRNAIGAEASKSNHPTERRTFQNLELRAVGTLRIAGHAAVFNELSEELWGFRELIRPGAFANTIKTADVRALWNHDPNYVLGRTKAGTLTLREDAKGLAIEAQLPDTQFARDLVKSIDRGDINQMSFGFRTVSDEWRMQDGENIRELTEVDLFDVSPVTFPAYPQTDVGLRTHFEERIAELRAKAAGIPVGVNIPIEVKHYCMTCKTTVGNNEPCGCNKQERDAFLARAEERNQFFKSRALSQWGSRRPVSPSRFHEIINRAKIINH